MSVVRVSYTTSSTDNVASATLAVPAGTQDGDVLVLLVSSDGTAPGSPPAGFTTAYSGTTGGSHQDAVHWKIANGEPASYTITPSTGTNERAWVCMIAYRGVDQLTPLESVNNIVNPVADQIMDVPAVTSTEAGSVAVAFGGLESGNAGNPVGANFSNGYVTISDNEFGPPGTGNGSSSGFFGEQDLPTPATTVPAGTVSYGGGNSHGQVIAFVLKAGEPPVIGVTGYDDELNYGESFSVAGFGFGATQGTGKVQLWSDIAGTIREDQVITSWSDASITYTATQGALSDDTRVYLVIINNDGDQSFSYPVTVGLAPYDVFLDELNFDHLWSFDGIYSDLGKYPTKLTIGSQQTTGDGGSFTTPIAEATSQSWRSLENRREPVNSPVMNQFALEERWFGGWFQANDIFKGLVCIYEEGGGVNNVSFYVGLGNRLIASFADTGDDNAQAFSDFALVPGRAYHISWGFSYNKEPKEFRMWIDGVKQTVTSGNPLTSAGNHLDAHGGDISFGGPGGNLEVAGTDVVFRSCTDGQYAWWFSTRVIPTDEQILNVFRRGALPTVTIGPDTSANMQAQLDALANTVRPNAGLCIRVNEPTDGTSLSLNADNVVFKDEASVWVEWRGRGALTWTNLNGSNLTQEKTYITKGGSINVVTPATLTLTGVAENSEVRVFEAGTQNEVAGQEVVTGGIFSATIQVPTVDIRLLRQGSQWLKLANIDTTVDTSLPVQQLLDRQFRND